MMDAMHSETVAYWITKFFNKGFCYRDIYIYIQYVLKHEHTICLRLRHLQLQRGNYLCVQQLLISYNDSFLEQDNFIASHDVVTL